MESHPIARGVIHDCQKTATGLKRSFDAPVKTAHSTFDRFLATKPRIGRQVYLAEGAIVVGDVTLGDFASVWYHAVLRGDINRIVVGDHTNIQDHAILHLAEDLPCQVGAYVTIGHGAIVHACTVGNETLVGMGAIILDGAVIGDQCLVGAGALVTQRSTIPPGSLVMGMPARVIRPLTAEERKGLRISAENYVENALYCLEHSARRRRRKETLIHYKK